MIFSSIFTGLFMTVGFTALIYNYVLMGGNSGLFFLVWGGGFSLAGLYFHYHGTIGKIGWQRQRFVRNTQTLEWYKNEYPQCVVTTNIVKCCFCESTSIRRYALKNNTYKIRNSCAKCGEVLFYTDED